MSLLDNLRTADVVCHDCGSKYGTYSVGCSSRWQGTCGVCGEQKPITEVRDYGYLEKGIKMISSLSEVAEEIDDHVILYLSEDQIEILQELMEATSDRLIDPVAEFKQLADKIQELYDIYCARYSLSPACKAYYEKYGEWPTADDNDMRWEGFRDAFNMNNPD